MFVYIDDSGDPGFKIGRGSTKVFIIALVIFDDDSEREKTVTKIKALQKQLNKYQDFEFRFNKCRRKTDATRQNFAVIIYYKLTSDTPI